MNNWPKIVAERAGYVFLIFFLMVSLLFLVEYAMPLTPEGMMVERVGGGWVSPFGVNETPRTLLRNSYVEKFGVGMSLPEKFVKLWERVLTFDYGVSTMRYPSSVSGILVNRVPWTLSLLLPAVLVSVVLGNWLGTVAVRRGGRMRNVLSFFSGWPPYILAIFFLFLFAVKLEWFPFQAAYSAKFIRSELSFQWFLDSFWHWILPFASVVLFGVVRWANETMEVLCEETPAKLQKTDGSEADDARREDTFQKKAFVRIMERVPVFLGVILSHLLLVEVVFNYRGIGTVIYYASFVFDYPLLEACVIISMIIIIIGKFSCDMIGSIF